MLEDVILLLLHLLFVRFSEFIVVGWFQNGQLLLQSFGTRHCGDEAVRQRERLEE